MGCCLEKLSDEEHVTSKKARPQITLIPPSDDEGSDERHETTQLSKGRRVVALYDYASRNSGDLTFRQYEEFDVIKGLENDWCYATRLDNGEKGYIPRNFVCFSDSLQSERWFFGTITRKDSENLLLKMKVVGTFLIRESETSENSYSLSLLNENDSKTLYVKHYRIRYGNDAFFITDGVEFSKLSSLIEYFREGAHGLCCQLTTPCTVRDTPQTYSLAPSAVAVEEKDFEQREKIRELHQYSVTHECVWKGKFHLSITTYQKHALSNVESMKRIHHKSVVKFFGCISEEPLKVCWEHLNGGTLLNYLTRNALDIADIINITTQVSTGMAYLESIPFAHRYLRAKHIAVGTGSTFKVAEYGLCSSPKDLDSDAIYWLSPECVEEDVFDIKSDVWSYGVLIAQLFEKGENPYHERGDSPGDFLDKLRSGCRPQKTRDCPDVLYELMTQCWDQDRTARPNFEYIQIFMESFFQRTGVNSGSP